MGVRLSFEEIGIVNVVVTGDVQLDEALEAVESIYSDTRFSLPSRILWDVSEGHFDWTPSEIQAFGDFLSDRHSPSCHIRVARSAFGHHIRRALEP